MPWIEREFDPEFKQWIEDFPATQMPKVYALLMKYSPEKQITIFRSRGEADDFLNHF